MTISYNSIPSSLRLPFMAVEFDSSKATQGAADLAYRVLLVGQMTTGTATANSIYKVTSADQVRTYCGQGSQLHRMAIAYFKNNTFTETWIGVLADNGGGTAGTKTLTVTGPATATGTLALYVAGTQVPVAVTSGDAQNTIATNINAAVGALLDLPVSSGVSTNVVTLTARNKGTAGNDIDVRLNYQPTDKTPTGVAVTIATGVSGATNPTLGTLIAALGDKWFQIIAHPYTDSTSLAALEAEMTSRAGPMRMIDGLCITSAAGTQSTLGTLGLTRNNQYSSILAQPGKNPLTPPCEFAAAAAGVVAYYAAIDAARPFQTLTLAGVVAPADTDLFTNTERNLNLYDGIGTTSAFAGQVALERLVTTYQTNGAGAADTAYLDANTVLTLMYLRYSFRTWIQSKYARAKLMSDGPLPAGQQVITPGIGKTEAILWFKAMLDKGLVENLDQFKADVVVERDGSNPNRLNWLLPPDLANQFVTGAAQIQFRV